MEVHIGYNKLAITAEPKTFHFDLLKDVGIDLKHEIFFIMEHNELLTEHTIKTRIDNYCANISLETIFMNNEDSKTNEPRKFVLNLSQRLDLRSSNKHVAPQNLFIYYSWKDIR